MNIFLKIYPTLGRSETVRYKYIGFVENIFNGSCAASNPTSTLRRTFLNCTNSVRVWKRKRLHSHVSMIPYEQLNFYATHRDYYSRIIIRIPYLVPTSFSISNALTQNQSVLESIVVVVA